MKDVMKFYLIYLLLNISARGRRFICFCRPRRRRHRPMTVSVIAAILNSSTVIEEERRHVIERYFAIFMRFLCVFLPIFLARILYKLVF